MVVPLRKRGDLCRARVSPVLVFYYGSERMFGHKLMQVLELTIRCRVSEIAAKPDMR